MAVAYWSQTFCEDYSGGTAPASHRIPCYGLGGHLKDSKISVTYSKPESSARAGMQNWRFEVGEFLRMVYVDWAM